MVVLGTVQGLEHPTYQILNCIVRGVNPIIDLCSVHRAKLLSSSLADENTCSFYVLPPFFLCLYNPYLLSFLPHLRLHSGFSISGDCFQIALLQYIK